MRNSAFSIAAAAILAASLSFACASVPKEIPEGLSSSELIQKAQEAADASKYKAAIAWYEAALDRYGDDVAVGCTCEYEIAFMYYKQGLYTVAEERFTKLLARYAGPGGEELPPRYKILAEKVLAKVQAKTGTTPKP